jgi:hypothetical protein
MRMANHMLVNFLTTKKMAKGNIILLMAITLKANGKIISSMDQE